MKNVVWHTFASALSIKFVFTFSPKITFFSTTFFLCNEKFEMLLVEWNRNNHSKEQATSILIRNFFIWNMFSLFPANGNISIWAIYNETYFSFSDKWSKLCILFLTSEFFTLDVRSIVPTLLLILRHWMSIVVQNSFYPSIYFSLYHPLGMIFYWMRKKIIQQQKIQINFSHISQYYMMNLYSKRSCIDKKPIFHCTRSLWVHPSHAIFLWFYYPMILIFDI